VWHTNRFLEGQGVLKIWKKMSLSCWHKFFVSFWVSTPRLVSKLSDMNQVTVVPLLRYSETHNFDTSVTWALKWSCQVSHSDVCCTTHHSWANHAEDSFARYVLWTSIKSTSLSQDWVRVTVALSRLLCHKEITDVNFFWKQDTMTNLSQT